MDSVKEAKKSCENVETKDSDKVSEGKDNEESTDVVDGNSRRARHAYENVVVSSEFGALLHSHGQDPFGPEFEADVSSASHVTVAAKEETRANTNKKKTNESYDEMTIQAGRPVLVQGGGSGGGDPLTDVQFTSPLRDRPDQRKPPTPAPRISKLRQLEQEHPPLTEAFNTSEVIYEELPSSLDLDNMKGSCSVGETAAGPTLDSRLPPNVRSPSSQQPPVCVNCNIYSDPVDTRRSSQGRGTTATASGSGGSGGSQATYFNMRPSTLLDEGSEDAPSEVISPLLFKPRNSLSSKVATLDIRRDVHKLWEMAVNELDRDREIVEFLEDREGSTTSSPKTGDARKSSRSRSLGGDPREGPQPPSSRRREYLSVAIPGQRFEIVNGEQRLVSSTLLKDFDPCFEVEEEDENDDEGQERVDTPEPKGELAQDSQSKGDSVPFRERKSSDLPSERDSSQSFTSVSSLDIPQPKEAPPPPPRNNVQISQQAEKTIVAKSPYENVWVPHNDNSVETSPGKEGTPLSLSAAASNAGDGLSMGMVSASSSSGSGAITNIACTPVSPTISPAAKRVLQTGRSSSTTNLSFLTKKLSFTSKFGRKLSDSRRASLAEDDESIGSKRKSSLMEVAGRCHSGPLNVSKTSKGASASTSSASQQKWCVLSDGSLRYFQQNSSMAEPKDTIPLRDVLSLYRRESDDGTPYFDVAFVRSKNKLSLRSFSSTSVGIRDTWLDRLASNLCGRDNFGSASKLGRANLKSLFSGNIIEL